MKQFIVIIIKLHDQSRRPGFCFGRGIGKLCSHRLARFGVISRPPRVQVSRSFRRRIYGAHGATGVALGSLDMVEYPQSFSGHTTLILDSEGHDVSGTGSGSI